MKVAIYRMMAYTPARDLTPDPDHEPFPLYSFGPLEPEDPRSLVGSGPYPWLVVEVPDGSRILFDALFVPGSAEGLHPVEVVERFGGVVDSRLRRAPFRRLGQPRPGD